MYHHDSCTFLFLYTLGAADDDNDDNDEHGQNDEVEFHVLPPHFLLETVCIIIKAM